MVPFRGCITQTVYTCPFHGEIRGQTTLFHVKQALIFGTCKSDLYSVQTFRVYTAQNTPLQDDNHQHYLNAKCWIRSPAS
jgi:hypothetical protein